jgi:hypothetical protein
MYKADIPAHDIPAEQLAGLLREVQGQGTVGDGSGKARLGGLIGGEACSWGEHADALNLDHRIFQRLPVVAERLWSTRLYTDRFKEESEARKRGPGRFQKFFTDNLLSAERKATGSSTGATVLADPTRPTVSVQVS